MEIIFCRCGGAKVILMIPHSPCRTFFSAGSSPSISHRKCGSVPVRGAEVPTSVQDVLNGGLGGFDFLLVKDFPQTLISFTFPY